MKTVTSVLLKSINRHNQNKWMYSDLDLVKWPVAHSAEIPIPSFIDHGKLPEEDESSTSAVDNTCG